MKLKIQSPCLPGISCHPDSLFDDGHVGVMGSGFVIYAAFVRYARITPPAASRVAAVCGLTLQALKTGIRDLVGLGYLEQVEAGDGNSRDTVGYIVNVPMPAEGHLAFRSRILKARNVETSVVASAATEDDAMLPGMVDLKPEQKKKVPQKPSGPVPEARDFFRRAWKARYGGMVECFWNFGKHDAIVDRILKSCGGLDRFKPIVEAYLKSDDDFVLKNTHSLEVLQSSLNRFVVAAAKAQREPEVGRYVKIYA